uniref:hypothetical protein n=1 Tax=Amycolatopsis sp. CA-096443 TaxID=3239919 RepID=UPI003F494DAF
MAAPGANASEPDDLPGFTAFMIASGADAAEIERDARAEPEPEGAPAAPRPLATPPPAPEPPPDKQPPPGPAPAVPAEPAHPVPDLPQPSARPGPADTAPSGGAQGTPGRGDNRTLRDALVDWIDVRAAARREHRQASDDAGHAPITVGAFVTICLMTLAVAALAFLLSFSMMYAAAKHYGWSEDWAGLFPVIIDVGAIGGTFMGAISTHRVFRSIGHHILVLTLAASVLFNLVGHDIKGSATSGLPGKWGWTATVAAVMIPLLLAYFVHAFSKALKTYTDQRRETRLAEQREQQARAEAERRNAARAARQSAPARDTREAARPAEPQHPRTAPPPPVEPIPNTKPTPPKKPAKDFVRKWIAENGNPGPTQMNRIFMAMGYARMSTSQLRLMANEGKTREQLDQDTARAKKKKEEERARNNGSE